MADEAAPLSRQEIPEPVADLGHKRDVGRKIDGIKRGRVEWVTEFTLATGATSTVVKADQVTPTSQVSLDPVTPEAAALVGKCWITAAARVPGNPSSGQQVGQFTVNHPLIDSGIVATFRASVKG